MSDETLKSPKAYSMWVIIQIFNEGSIDLKMKNIDVSYGKLHADGQYLLLPSYRFIAILC